MNNIQYILKDKPLAAWSMDSDSFPNIYDLSGNFHDGVYNHNTLYNLEIFPLLGGSNNGILIDNSKGLSFPNIEIADANNSNNAFSIELWVYIKNSNSEYINLFSSSSNEISIKYKKGGIYFNVGSETTVAKVDNSKRVLHIVATYTPQYICLYINGTRLSKKILNNFKFNIINDSNTTFNIGPTNDQNSFIIDDVSVYKYELSDNQILNHYNYPSTNSPEQVAYKNSGVVFYGNDSSLYSSIKRSYPSQISWKNFYSDEILYSSTDNSLSLSPGVNQSFIYDSFTVLPAINILSSKIEWDDAEGVNLYVSTTGEPDSYSLCKNGYSIPGWTSDIVSKPIPIDSNVTRVNWWAANENPEIWNDELKSSIYTIAERMVELEDKFIDLAFGVNEMEGLTKEEVKKYIRYIADRRLIGLGMKGIFKVKRNPLPWVEEMINAPTHTNFFENRATDYAKGAVQGNWGDVWAH